MNRILAAVLTIGMSLPAAGSADGPIAWRDDYSKAFTEAKAANKILLINVHTTWCGPCRMLQETTLKDPALARLIESTCVPLSLDGDENANLVRRLGVQAFPTQVFVAPDGRIVGRLEGCKPADVYSKVLGMALAQCTPAPKTVAQSESKPEPQPPSRPVTQNVSATASVQQTAQTKPPVFAQTSMVTDTAVKPCNADAPLALKGYCPVCMITKAQLVEGDVSTCVTYAGHRYVFRTVEEKKQFEAEPRKYLPGADGVCLVTLMDSGKVTLGSVEWPAIFEDKVYLFADSANRRKFLEDPEKYVNSWQQASHTQPTLR